MTHSSRASLPAITAEPSLLSYLLIFLRPAPSSASPLPPWPRCWFHSAPDCANLPLFRPGPLLLKIILLRTTSGSPLPVENCILLTSAPFPVSSPTTALHSLHSNHRAHSSFTYCPPLPAPGPLPRLFLLCEHTSPLRTLPSTSAGQGCCGAILAQTLPLRALFLHYPLIAGTEVVSLIECLCDCWFNMGLVACWRDGCSRRTGTGAVLSPSINFH